MRRVLPSLVTFAALALFARESAALDKQGSGAHGGNVQQAEENSFDVSGTLTLGLSLWNPTYAARPNNSGHTLMRYAAHADVDLIGSKLSIPIDVNMFTDRDARPGARIFAPSELDVITGITSTWNAGPGSVEVGTRVEHDRPMDDGGYDQAPMPLDVSQTYVDARARYLYSLAKVWPSIGRALHDGDVAGWFTFGWFTYNPTAAGTYYARPDNTGRALFRYAAHVEVSTFSDLVSFGYDATVFTDSRGDSAIRPTELDLTTEAILHVDPWELHLAYERDLPIDRTGLRQSFVYALVGWSFDLKKATTRALTDTTHLPSP